MFTQPCFIRKNTIDIQSKLERLGYKSCADINDICDSICTFTRDNKPKYMAFKVDDDFEINIKNDYPFIDCGTNERLFLAIAALRDDTDKYQLFLHNNKVFGDSGWEYCKDDKFQMIYYAGEVGDNEYFTDTTEKYHKATVEELIEHFK